MNIILLCVPSLALAFLSIISDGVESAVYLVGCNLLVALIVIANELRERR